MNRLFFSLTYLLFFWMFSFSAIAQSFNTLNKFDAPQAHQGIAVDENYFYPVATRSVAKHDKRTGGKVAEWKESEDGPVLHLDSGVIVDGKLYAAHSNYPGIPMTSSVEIWDTKTLQHTGSHSFGIRWGSFTWLDRHDGFWWGAFAHYERFEEQLGKDNRWTTIVKFNEQWQPLEEWALPEAVLERLHPMSNSGGSWGPDGYLYLSGHDLGELYKMSLPKRGSELVLEAIIPIENEGQGIAWDRSEEGIIYTIIRENKQVVVSKAAFEG